MNTDKKIVFITGTHNGVEVKLDAVMGRRDLKRLQKTFAAEFPDLQITTDDYKTWTPEEVVREITGE